MYTNAKLQIINDSDAVVGTDGVQYPGNWPKATIPGLTAVNLASVPTDPSVIVTGFIIDASHNQVWQTTPKTTQQLAADAAAAQTAADATAAKAYAKLAALLTMTPAQVQAWVTANVTTLPAAQDAITTLAIAVSILGRRL